MGFVRSNSCKVHEGFEHIKIPHGQLPGFCKEQVNMFEATL